MHAKITLLTLLTAMLLADTLHCLNWQGTGSGMNSTVITEIWAGLESKINDVVNSQRNATAANSMTKEISDRLNGRWDPAWNVVFAVSEQQYDTVLYGYAFRNQWMWYNGVPNALFSRLNRITTIIVWKDYNCQNWQNIAKGAASDISSFSTAQKDLIKTEMSKMTEANIKNDVWQTAYNMMNNLNTRAEFSSGGYSVIMNQSGDAAGEIYGYVCRVGNGFYYSYKELGSKPIAGTVGSFYLFQTR